MEKEDEASREGRTIPSRPFRVSIEGNIGSGKSTLIQYFSKFPEVETFEEPIDEWRNVQGHNLLEYMYKDPIRWNCLFQHYVQLSRLSIQTKMTHERVVMFERSVQNNRFCFLEVAHKSNMISNPEYIILCEWYDWMNKHMDISLDLIVYLRTNPEVVYRRMMERNRPEEREVPRQYLQMVHDAYENWLIKKSPYLPPAPVLVINGDVKLDQMENVYNQYSDTILGSVRLPS